MKKAERMARARQAVPSYHVPAGQVATQCPFPNTHPHPFLRPRPVRAPGPCQHGHEVRAGLEDLVVDGVGAGPPAGPSALGCLQEHQA